MGERIGQFFVGGAPRLKVEEVVHSASDRFRLQTVASGLVHLQIGIVTKDFERNHVRMG